jgi:hypothetical protein
MIGARGVSVYVLSIIAADPHWVPTSENADDGLKTFRRLVAGTDEVTAEFFAGLQFVDQGENFESVCCPCCGGPLDVAWWQRQMDAVWSREQSRFERLEVTTPCCDTVTSLNDLEYRWPAGFASFALRARNPDPGGLLPDHELGLIAAALGCSARQVYAHY